MNNETIQAMLKKFLPFAQERMGFESIPEIRLENDEDNAQQPLGKTAYYDPSNSTVTVFVNGRHPKDIMRSVSHELVHHTQNGRGEFEKVTTVGEGYAQSDDHLRNMEKEAYTEGNLCFRDWEDSVKTQNEELNMFEKRNKRLNESIMKKFGYAAKEEIKESIEENLEEEEGGEGREAYIDDCHKLEDNLKRVAGFMERERTIDKSGPTRGLVRRGEVQVGGPKEIRSAASQYKQHCPEGYKMFIDNLRRDPEKDKEYRDRRRIPLSPGRQSLEDMFGQGLAEDDET